MACLGQGIQKFLPRFGRKAVFNAGNYRSTFFGWLAFFPDNFVWDISIFVVAVIIGYILSYQILKKDHDYKLTMLWAILILIGLAKFSLFTYFPPHIFLFRDPVGGGYGIESKSTEVAAISDGPVDQPIGSTVILGQGEEIKKLNIVTKEFSPPETKESVDLTGFAGAPLTYANEKSRVNYQVIANSIDHSKSLVTYKTEDMTTEPDAYDGSQPTLKSEDYLCIFASKSCVLTNILVDAKKAANQEYPVYFSYWDSEKAVIFGNISADGMGNSAPVFRFDINSKKITQTVGYSANDVSGSRSFSMMGFNSDMSQFVLSETDESKNFQGLVVFDSTSMKEVARHNLKNLFAKNEGVMSIVWDQGSGPIYFSSERSVFVLDIATSTTKIIYTDDTADSSGLYWDWNRMVLTPNGRYLLLIDYYNPDKAINTVVTTSDNNTRILKAIDLKNTSRVFDIVTDPKIYFSFRYY